MGFFSKKPSKNKIYEFEKAMKIIAGNPEYNAIEVEGGYKIVSDEIANKKINMIKEKRKNFINSISGNGIYGNIKVEKNNYVPAKYNNYENNYIER